VLEIYFAPILTLFNFFIEGRFYVLLILVYVYESISIFNNLTFFYFLVLGNYTDSTFFI
jgi:hypothetical protein